MGLPSLYVPLLLSNFRKSAILSSLFNVTCLSNKQGAFDLVAKGFITYLMGID